MRLLVTGLDADGRSCLVSATDVVPGDNSGMPGLRTAVLHQTTQSPPPARVQVSARNVDTQLAPGCVRWMLIEHESRDPDEEHAGSMHTTDAVDLVQVLEGTADLLLDDGAHPVGPGDFVVMAGVNHALRPRSGGCQLVAVAIATPPVAG